ncbi:hypothetical protein NJ76_24820, partial [Rhodococcus sp. IITR03]
MYYKDQGCAGSASPTTRAPGTGPEATRTVRHTPRGDFGAQAVDRGVLFLDEERTRGPEPETMPARRRPRHPPGASVAAWVERQAAACRSL